MRFFSPSTTFKAFYPALKINRVQKEDSQRIYSFFRAQGMSRWGAIWSREAFDQEICDHKGLWAQSPKGQLVGVLLYRSHAEEVELTQLATDHSWRSKGVMSQLFHSLHKEEPGKALFAEVFEENWPALRFYKSQGFRVIGRRPGYYCANRSALVLAAP